MQDPVKVPEFKHKHTHTHTQEKYDTDEWRNPGDNTNDPTNHAGRARLSEL